jgi:hypothetical protein
MKTVVDQTQLIHTILGKNSTRPTDTLDLPLPPKIQKTRQSTHLMDTGKIQNPVIPYHRFCQKKPKFLFSRDASIPKLSACKIQEN